MATEPRLAIESIAGRRPYQEDAVLARILSDGRVLVAVADGMGGHAAGEVASAVALETLLSALEDGKTLDVAFVMANRNVFEKAKEPGKQGMGTTLVAALVDDGEYFVANVGDSRGYLVTPDGLRQITDDHSFVAEAVKRGQTQEQAESTPWRDALTRSIGTEGDVDVDVFGPFPLASDSAILICSDGLYKVMNDDELRRIFVQSANAEGAAQSLVATALDRGSDDNISVAIAEFGEVPRQLMQATMPIDYVPPPPPDPGATAPYPALGSEEAVGVERASGHAEPSSGTREPASGDSGESAATGPGGGSIEPSGGSMEVVHVPAGPPLGAIIGAVLVLLAVVVAVVVYF